ncbi:MAG: hypothetical protein ACRDTP_02555 [Mycobacteriales bacterium]
MTAAGQINAGSRLTAAMVRGVAPLSAYKNASEAGTNVTTLHSDNALFIPLLADAVYDFELVLGYEGGSLGSSDLKIGWALPGGATMGYTAYGNTTSGNATDGPWYTASSTPAFGTNGTSTPIGLVASGTIVTSSAAGTMQLRWAKNSTSVSTLTTVLAGSVLLAWQVQ